MRRRAFTLIELLVVIAIIAILAAILFPVFAKARQRAQKTTCVSNINQICKGILMYCDDNDGYFPRGMDYLDYKRYPELSTDTPPVPLLWGGNPRRDTNWKDMDGPIGAYLKSKEVWHCPSDIGQLGVGTIAAKSVFKEFGSSYTWPAVLAFKSSGGRSVYKPFMNTQVKFPTRAFMICDALPLYGNFGKDTEPAGTWHGDKKNRSYSMGFADGHVQTISEKEFMNPPDLKGTGVSDYMWTSYYVTGHK